MNQYIIVHQQDGIANISLNRPEVHNALNPELIKELTQTLQSINADSSVRVVLLTAVGKHFCAGADLKWMQQSIDYTEEQNFADAWQLSELMHTLFTLNKPSISAIQGATYGGGLGLIACCDIVLASTEANFCFSEVKLGLVPAVISPYVTAAIGTRAAQRYYLTAEPFSADTALAINLIHEIVEPTELQNKAQATAQQICQNAPNAILQTKQLLKEIAPYQINETLRKKTATLIAKTRISSEAQERIKKFLLK